MRNWGAPGKLAGFASAWKGIWYLSWECKKTPRHFWSERKKYRFPGVRTGSARSRGRTRRRHALSWVMAAGGLAPCKGASSGKCPRGVQRGWGMGSPGWGVGGGSCGLKAEAQRSNLWNNQSEQLGPQKAFPGLGDSCDRGCPLVPRNQHSEGTRALLPGNRGSPMGEGQRPGKRQPGVNCRGRRGSGPTERMRPSFLNQRDTEGCVWRDGRRSACFPGRNSEFSAWLSSWCWKGTLDRKLGKTYPDNVKAECIPEGRLFSFLWLLLIIWHVSYCRTRDHSQQGFTGKPGRTLGTIGL